jgi:D-alanyl-D-alanine carboxypeptidase
MSEKIEKIYGKACTESNLVIANIAFPLKIAWDKGATTKKIQCHKLVKDDIENIFKDILKEYGLPKIKELGIDIYGGCYNCRLMRGGTKQSMHAWAIALDLDPERNQLKWGKDKAQFAKPEYKPLFEIFKKYGWENLGDVIGRDYMHWQKKV